MDHAPAEVYATLLDARQCVCSERTMYRLLAEHAEARERRDQLRHPGYAAPELLARRPNELWSCVVGWMVTHQESATLAERFMHETCARQGTGRDHLTIHADRGGAGAGIIEYPGSPVAHGAVFA